LHPRVAWSHGEVRQENTAQARESVN